VNKKEILAAVKKVEALLPAEFQNANISVNRDANGTHYNVQISYGTDAESFSTRVGKQA
jgi:hypothetical protein